MKIREGTAGPAVHKLKQRKYGLSHWQLTAMFIPAVVLVLLFSYLPMFGIIIAFKNFRFNLGIWGSEWCGFENFRFLFESDSFKTLMRNTLGYNITWILLGKIAGIVMALCMEGINNKYCIKVFQSGMFIPYFLSWIVVSYFSHSLFAYEMGMVNSFISQFGVEKIAFYTTPKWWPLILTVFSLWKGLGYGTLLYYGTMLGIDQSLYEAATIDGCGYLKRVWHITLPHLKYIVLVTLIMDVGGIFNSDYGLFYFLTKDNGALYSVADTFDTYVFRTLRNATNLGLSSAISFLKSVVGLSLVLITNAVVKKFDDDCALL